MSENRNVHLFLDDMKDAIHRILDYIQDIDWKYIIGMRNLITHRYFDVDMWILWTTITEDLPRLESQLKMIIDN